MRALLPLLPGKQLVAFDGVRRVICEERQAVSQPQSKAYLSTTATTATDSGMGEIHHFQENITAVHAAQRRGWIHRNINSEAYLALDKQRRGKCCAERFLDIQTNVQDSIGLSRNPDLLERRDEPIGTGEFGLRVRREHGEHLAAGGLSRRNARG